MQYYLIHPVNKHEKFTSVTKIMFGRMKGTELSVSGTGSGGT
jgi:hypothetical protein